jgi:hypothetical protein
MTSADDGKLIAYLHWRIESKSSLPLPVRIWSKTEINGV